MSYDIIKSITVNKENQVMVCSAASNVTPKTYHPFHATSLTRILKEQGRAELDRVIFTEFRKGNFQGMSTQYAKALVWQQVNNTSFSDDVLLAEFKKAWNDNQPVEAFFQGHKIHAVGRWSFRYRLDSSAPGMVFKNMAQARYMVRNFADITFESISS